MKNKKLSKLVDELLIKAIKEEGSNFYYAICPYFRDCPREVMKICISDYGNCRQYRIFKIKERK